MICWYTLILNHPMLTAITCRRDLDLELNANSVDVVGVCSYRYGESCHYSCRRGHFYGGRMERICTETGSMDKALPLCSGLVTLICVIFHSVIFWGPDRMRFDCNPVIALPPLKFVAHDCYLCVIYKSRHYVDRGRNNAITFSGRPRSIYCLNQ